MNTGQKPTTVKVDTADLAQAIRDAFITPMGTNIKPGAANLADAADSIARQLKYLGNGSALTEFGAIENLSMQIKEGADRIA